MFTAQYALSPYVKQIRFVFKGLNGESHRQAETEVMARYPDWEPK
jgi:hypothetical protein